MVVEVIDAPWAGVPARFWWFKRRWICREHACQTVIFLEHDERVCAPRARLGVRAIRWAIRQLRFEGARRARRTVSLRYPDRDGGSLPGTARTPSTINSKTPPASSMPSISSSSLATLQVRCAARVQQDTTGHCGRKGDPLYQIRLLLRACRDWLTKCQQERLREAFTADEAHVSVDVAYLHRASARGLPPSHTHPRPTPGRTPNPAPTSLSHPRNRSPGSDPTRVEGRLLGLLRHRRSQQRLHRSHQLTLSSWADAPPEATATPPTTNSECSSSQEA